MTSPTHRTTHRSPALLLQASARRVATGPFLSSDDHRQCHITQHHHPACEPLLIGRYGGADNDDQEGSRMTGNNQQQGMTNNREQPTTNNGNREQQGTTNNGNNKQRERQTMGTTNNGERPTAGNDQQQGMTNDASPHAARGDAAGYMQDKHSTP
jgi:hypothetical protein